MRKRKEKIWEIYFDKCKTDLTNDNYSCFIRSSRKPTKKEALEVVKKHKALYDGYHLLFIGESNWDYIDEKDIWDGLEK